MPNLVLGFSVYVGSHECQTLLEWVTSCDIKCNAYIAITLSGFKKILHQKLKGVQNWNLDPWKVNFKSGVP